MKADELIIFSDMDGTILTDWDLGPVVPDANLNAIGSFVSEGGLFSIATGRQFLDTLCFFPGMAFPVPTVQDNGSVVYDPVRGEVLRKTYLDESAKLECLDYINGKSGIWLVCADEIYLYRVLTGDENADAVPGHLRRRTISVDEYLAKSFVKVCYVLEAPAGLMQVSRDLESFRSADSFTVMQSSPVFLEILDKSVGKAPAVAQAVKLAGAESRKLVCIGDYDNDCDMLALADIAACPSNSSPRALGMADIVTCPNNDGAVADLIRRLGAI